MNPEPTTQADRVNRTGRLKNVFKRSGKSYRDTSDTHARRISRREGDHNPLNGTEVRTRLKQLHDTCHTFARILFTVLS